MRIRDSVLAAAVVAAGAWGAQSAQAGVVNSADVVIGGNTYHTFEDDVSGLTWLDLDNFWDATTTYNDVESMFASTNFHIATLSDITALESSIGTPSGAAFATTAFIVGGNYVGKPGFGDRDLLWGAFDDGSGSATVTDYAYQYVDQGWQHGDDATNKSATLRSHNSTSQDLGVWVVSNNAITAVPLPAASTMGFGMMALVGAGVLIRRRRQATA